MASHTTPAAHDAVKPGPDRTIIPKSPNDATPVTLDAPAPHEQLIPGDLAPGEPVPLDVYDRNGVKLLARGQIVRSERQLERLLEIGLWGEAEAVAALRERPIATEAGETDWQQVSVFEQLARVREELAAVLGREGPELAEGIGRLAARVRRAVSLDANAAIASIQWLRTAPYAVRQSVNVAVLADVVLEAHEADDATRDAAVAAALSMNVCIVDLQETLYRVKDMTPDQKSAIARHPQGAVERLRAAGVDDEAWLRAVMEHHEADDGTGYPRKLSGSAICLHAQVISVADKFCATIAERAYRAAVPVSVALRRLLTASGPTMDPIIAARLAREIGIYPPGTVVRLRSGDVGVAIKRTLDPNCPVVRVVLGRDGQVTPGFTKRLTSREMFSVTQELGREALPAGFDVFRLWHPSLEKSGADPS